MSSANFFICNCFQCRQREGSWAGVIKAEEAVDAIIEQFVINGAILTANKN